MNHAMPYHPAPWLPGPHLQSVWGRVARSRRRVTLRREILPTPDGDEIVLDHLDGTRDDGHLLLLHGLEGSSNSVYIQGMLALARSAGLSATALNFRSCAREPDNLHRTIPNRTSRLYHSGETTDIDHVVRTLRSRFPRRRLVAFGGSLGGNALLKWLGEDPGHHRLAAAATASVPYDLEAGARHLETPLGRLYTRHFVKTLGIKAATKKRLFPEAAAGIDLDRALHATTFHEFDEAATAPLHGFASAEDYWERSSSIRFLHAIDVPTLALSAEDDPFLPPGVLDEVRATTSPAVELVTTAHGGHLGFVAGALPWRPRYWVERTAFAWLEHFTRA